VRINHENVNESWASRPPVVINTAHAYALSPDGFRIGQGLQGTRAVTSPWTSGRSTCRQGSLAS